MADFYHGIWQVRFRELDNLCHKCTSVIRQTLMDIWQN